MSAKDVAQKHSGTIVQCNLTKSNPAMDANGQPVSSFKGRIIGYRRPTLKDTNEYVIVEVMPPNTTNFTVASFSKNSILTWKAPDASFAKKLLESELIIPFQPSVVRNSKQIPDWPHKCKDCGSAAFIASFMIDCSNVSCKNKFKSKSAQDLFIPKELRPVEKPIQKAKPTKLVKKA